MVQKADIEKRKVQTEILKPMTYEELLAQIGQMLTQGRRQAMQAVNLAHVQMNWYIGKYIVEFEQGGNSRAKYGQELLNQLSRDLTLRYGKGFSRSNLFQIRQFYLKFPKIQTLSGFLSWSHYTEILKAENDLEISFYSKQCELENWSVRELKRQMKSLLFQRLAKNKKNKEEILALSREGLEVSRPEDLIKDPFILEFVGIPVEQNFTESDLENQLIENLQKFLMELGKGFTFVGRQYRINIGSRNFYVDLVFYHRILKCFVLIDLKRGEVEHNDVGQMNLYLNYFRSEENTEGDGEPIGIILGTKKDSILIEYATQNISNQLFVSKYQLYLPEKEELQAEILRVLERY